MRKMESMCDQENNQTVNERLVDLASDIPEIYETANAWFLRHGIECASVLINALDDESLGSICHWRILLLLRHFPEEKKLVSVILKALRRALQSNDPIVLPGAMEALAVFRTPEAMDVLVGLLQENDLDVVKHAAVLLGQTDDTSAIEPLLHMMHHDNPSIRYSAASALIQLGGPSVHAVLRQHLQKEVDPEVRELITKAGMGSPKTDTGDDGNE